MAGHSSRSLEGAEVGHTHGPNDKLVGKKAGLAEWRDLFAAQGRKERLWSLEEEAGHSGGLQSCHEAGRLNKNESGFTWQEERGLRRVTLLYWMQGETVIKDEKKAEVLTTSFGSVFSSWASCLL